jgi:hypothetical protein
MAAADPDLLVKWAPLVALRRRLHMYPEVGFKEFVTHCALRRALEEIAGLDPTAMRRMAVTGLICDIYGTGEPEGDENEGGLEIGDKGEDDVEEVDLAALVLDEEGAEHEPDRLRAETGVSSKFAKVCLLCFFV